MWSAAQVSIVAAMHSYVASSEGIDCLWLLNRIVVLTSAVLAPVGYRVDASEDFLNVLTKIYGERCVKLINRTFEKIFEERAYQSLSITLDTTVNDTSLVGRARSRSSQPPKKDLDPFNESSTGRYLRRVIVSEFGSSDQIKMVEEYENLLRGVNIAQGRLYVCACLGRVS